MKCKYLEAQIIEPRRYTLSTLRDVYEQVPSDRIETCLRELAAMMLLHRAVGAVVSEVSNQVGEVAGCSPWPDDVVWVDDNIGEVAVNLRGDKGESATHKNLEVIRLNRDSQTADEDARAALVQEDASLDIPHLASRRMECFAPGLMQAKDERIARLEARVRELEGAAAASLCGTMERNPNGCGCRLCNPRARWFVVCDTCQNKRCPKATNHALACSGSNAPGQIGSCFQ